MKVRILIMIFISTIMFASSFSHAENFKYYYYGNIHNFPKIYKLKPPGNFKGYGNSALPGKPQVRLIWDDTSDNEDGFLILRNPGPNTWSVETPYAKVAANSTNFVDKNVEPETNYAYAIVSQKYLSNFSPSAFCSVTVGDPRPPEDLKATVVSSTEVELSWKITSLTANSIWVLRRLYGAGWEPIFKQNSTTPTTFMDHGLTPYEVYEYAVINYAGSVPSNLSNITAISPH
jgi:hypothetical protein